MQTEEGLLISELAQKSGVTVRTIRYYIQEGLLPQPDTRGRYSVYDEDYLARLELIQRLKDAFLPLKEIKRRIENLTDQEIKQLLALSSDDFKQKLSEDNIPEMHEITEGSSDALSYIARILDAHNEDDERTRVQSPSRRLNRPPEPRPYDIRRESRWQRIEIMPGIELHIREHLLKRYKTNIEMAVQEIANIFKNTI